MDVIKPKITDGPQIANRATDLLNSSTSQVKSFSSNIANELNKLGIKINKDQLEKICTLMYESENFKRYLNINLIKHGTDFTKIKSSYKGLSTSEPYMNAFLAILSIYLTYDLSLKTLESAGININSIAGIGIEPLAVSTALSASIAHYRHAIAKHIRNGYGILEGTGKLIKEGKVVKKLTMALAALGITANIVGLGSKILSGKIQMGQQIEENVKTLNWMIHNYKNDIKEIKYYKSKNQKIICRESKKHYILPPVIDSNGFKRYGAVSDAMNTIGHCAPSLNSQNYLDIDYSNLNFPGDQSIIQNKLSKVMNEFQNTHGNIDITTILEKKYVNLQNKMDSLIDEIQVLQKSLNPDSDIKKIRKIFNEISKITLSMEELLENNIYGIFTLYEDTDKLIDYAIYGKVTLPTNGNSYHTSNPSGFKTNKIIIAYPTHQLKITPEKAMTPFELWDHYEDLSSKLLGTVALLLSGILINLSGLFAIGRLKRREGEDENKIENLNQKKLIDEYLEKVIDQLTEMINDQYICLNILPHGIKVPRSIIKKATYQCITDFQLTQESNIASSATALKWNSTIDFISGGDFADALIKKILPGSANYDRSKPNAFAQMQQENNKNLESLGQKTPSMKLSATMSEDGYLNFKISEIENVDNISFKINKNNEKTCLVSKNTFAAKGKLEYGDNIIRVKGINNETGSISKFIIKCRSNAMFDLLKLNKHQLINRLSVNPTHLYSTTLENQKMLAQRCVDIGEGERVLSVYGLDDSVYDIAINPSNMMELINMVQYDGSNELINGKIWERREEILDTGIIGIIALINNGNISSENNDYALGLIDQINIKKNSFVEVFKILQNSTFVHNLLIETLINKLFTEQNSDCSYIVNLFINLPQSSMYSYGSSGNTVNNSIYRSIGSNIYKLFSGGSNENLNKLANIFININSYAEERWKCHSTYWLYKDVREELITNGSIDNHIDILGSYKDISLEIFQDFSYKFNSEDIIKNMSKIIKGKPAPSAELLLKIFKCTYKWISNEKNPKSKQDLEPIKAYCLGLKIKDREINQWNKGIIDFIDTKTTSEKTV